MARRHMLLASAVLVLQSAIVVAQTPPSSAPRLAAPIVAPLRPGASALLAIDQNRTTVIDRIVTQWGGSLAQSSAALPAEQLRTLLSGLRADHLLAASLAGNLDGLRNAISTAVTSTAVVSPSLLHTKALGDANDDLVYTPINPCRIVDTRLGAGGFLGNDTERDWKVSRPGGNFTDQGGSSSDCAIPASPAAVLANFAVTGSSQPGVLFAWAFNQPAPTASTLNYAGGETIANAVIVPLAQGLTEDLSVFVSTGTDVVVDVVGYFKPPGGAGLYFVNGGNVFGTTAKLGTLDNQPVEIYANNQRVMRYAPNATSTNVIGGHANNLPYIGVIGATIGGGGAAGVSAAGLQCALGAFGDCRNAVSDTFGTVSGGAANFAGDGDLNATDSPFATVGGGLANTASSLAATVGGGWLNTASGTIATVGGGEGNTASGGGATVPGGYLNTASGNYSVAVGYANTAAGEVSFAAGAQATIPASAPGSFFWNDRAGAQSLPPNAHDEFIVIATNGIGMYTYKDFSHGCALVGTAGSWACTSDRATKTDFTTIEPRDVLARLVDMPITQWRWTGEAEAVRHMGPMAQDFRAAFGLGYDDKTITLVDNEGVALAAIQGLNQVVQEKDARIAALELKAESQQHELAQLRKTVEALLAKMGGDATVAIVH